jgi:hypothetical protein
MRGRLIEESIMKLIRSKGLRGTKRRKCAPGQQSGSLALSAEATCCTANVVSPEE